MTDKTLTIEQEATVWDAVAERLDLGYNDLDMERYLDVDDGGFDCTAKVETIEEANECGTACCIVGLITMLDCEEAKILVKKHTHNAVVFFENIDGDLRNTIGHENYLTHASNPSDPEEMAKRCKLHAQDLRDGGNRLQTHCHTYYGI